MSAASSGVTPSPGITYSNLFLFYSRDRFVGPAGETVATGLNTVLMDLNSFVWVSSKNIAALGGARYSFSITLPIANNSLSNDVTGPQSGGGGFADSFYQPLILAWQTSRADLRAAAGFLAPTGAFHAGASDNVGSGYWTGTLSAGQTVYITGDRKFEVSAFEMYEFHSIQSGTETHPGQTLDLDYSLAHRLALTEGASMQLGIAGYEQWQTTATTGPGASPAESDSRYRVNALGILVGASLPPRKVNLNLKLFREFSNRSTFQGNSAQIAFAITF